MAALAAAGIVSALALSGQAVAAAGQQAPPAGPCIAIVTPSVQGIEGNAAEIGTSVRDLFVTYLTGPSIRVIQLQARLASQVIAEAKQQNCDQVLTATLTRKRGGGTLGKVMGQAAGTASWSIPGGGTTTSAIARGAAVGVAQAVSSLASTTRAKDELQLEYRVSSAAGAATVGPKTEKLKATVDGEDLLTPLVGRASEAIATALVK
jgi:hypothetical protein